MGDFPFAVTSGAALAQQATTAAAGVALVNGTPNIISWTVPNDGNLHGWLLLVVLDVTSNETGGQIQVGFTEPGGTTGSQSLIGPNATTGTYNPIQSGSAWPMGLSKPGTTVTIKQGSALTGGAATLYAQIFGF